MMPEMTITLSAEAEALLARLEDRAGMLQAIAKALDLQTQLTVGHIVKTRLRGKGPFPPSEHRLGERSHKLWKSLRGTKAIIVGDAVTTTVGSEAAYAGIHEVGGTIHRKSSTGFVRLRTDPRGNLLRQGAGGKLAIFAKKSHKRFESVRYKKGGYDILIPERAPIRTGIADRLREIGSAISAAIIRFWQKGKGA